MAGNLELTAVLSTLLGHSARFPTKSS